MLIKNLMQIIEPIFAIKLDCASLGLECIHSLLICFQKNHLELFMKKDFLSFLQKPSNCFFFVCIFFLSTTSHALPFNIVPKEGVAFPTTVNQGSTATAYYTVSNKTTSARNNNFVKYLPPNVSQVTQGGTYDDTCGSSFNLAAKGQTGDSCTLQLTVSGAVNGYTPNPQNHLFVCFPGGKTCAGTAFSLNVSQTTQSTPSLSFAYFANEGAPGADQAFSC